MNHVQVKHSFQEDSNIYTPMTNMLLTLYMKCTSCRPFRLNYKGLLKPGGLVLN